MHPNVYKCVYVVFLTEAWKLVDSQDYLLPHRRTRAWGLAAVTGEEEVCRLPSSFPSCLEELASRVKIPNDQFFLPAKEVPIKPGRQAEVLEQAAELYGRENLYVDVSTSTKRTMAAANVAPCVTPSHPIYSTRLNRYLLKEEFLRVQGLCGPHVSKKMSMRSTLKWGKIWQATPSRAQYARQPSLHPW